MVSLNLGGMGATATNALMSWGFWLLLTVLVIAIIFGSLYMRKKGKFMFPAMILTDIGNGKLSVTFSRAGWFKSKKILGGLIDYSGEKRLEVKDGRMVQQGSSRDFHELKYKAGLILMAKADDPKILVPVSEAKLTPDSQRLLLQIAPADYRDSCSKIIQDTADETKATWQQIAVLLVLGFVGVIFFVSIILVIQYSKNTLADANAIHKEALGFYEKTLNTMSAIPSTAP